MKNYAKKIFYKALILQGEIWCWSLLGLKGLSNHSHSACQSPVLWLERPIELGGSHDEFESHLEHGNPSAWAFGCYNFSGTPPFLARKSLEVLAPLRSLERQIKLELSSTFSQREKLRVFQGSVTTSEEE